MALDDDKNKKKLLIDDISKDEEEGGETGGSDQGGSQGQIEFHDFLTSSERVRDDLLSPNEKNRLLDIHRRDNEHRVKKTKAELEQRKKMQNGEITLSTLHQRQAGSGMNSTYEQNPALNKAQFSGIDKQVNPLANLNVENTNQDKKAELLYQLRLKQAPEAAPRFNPKPQFNR